MRILFSTFFQYYNYEFVLRTHSRFKIKGTKEVYLWKQLLFLVNFISKHRIVN